MAIRSESWSGALVTFRRWELLTYLVGCPPDFTSECATLVDEVLPIIVAVSRGVAIKFWARRPATGSEEYHRAIARSLRAGIIGLMLKFYEIWGCRRVFSESGGARLPHAPPMATPLQLSSFLANRSSHAVRTFGAFLLIMHKYKNKLTADKYIHSFVYRWRASGSPQAS